MSVGDIDPRDLRERAAHRADPGLISNPENPVAHAVLKGHIVERLLPPDLLGNPAQIFACGIAQKDRSRVGIAGVHMADAVFFLLRARILMPADLSLFILSHRRAAHKSGLAPAFHRQLI